MILHAVLFLGLYQTGYTKEEWRDIEGYAREHGVGSGRAIMETSGPTGYVRYLFMTNQDEKLYLEYSKLAFNGKFNADYVEEKRGRPFDGELPKRPWPYRDVQVEYPPGAFMAILPPALLSDSYRGYKFWLAAWMGFLHILNLILVLYLLIPKSVGAEAFAGTFKRLLWWSLAFCLLLGNVVTVRMDTIVVTWMLLAALAFRHCFNPDRRKAMLWATACGGVAALGVMTKIIPGIVVGSAVILFFLSLKGWERLSKPVALFVGLIGVLGVSNLAMLMIFGDNYFTTYTYHLMRGIQIESLYGGAILGWSSLMGAACELENTYGSINFVSQATSALQMLAFFLFFSLVGFSALRVSNGLRSSHAPGKESPDLQSYRMIVLLSVLLMIFMLTNKIYSPQYNIWLGPFILGLVAVRRDVRRIGFLFLLAMLLTQGLYPRLYYLLKQGNPYMILLLNIRNIVMVIILVMLLKSLPELISNFSVKKES